MLYILENRSLSLFTVINENNIFRQCVSSFFSQNDSQIKKVDDYIQLNEQFSYSQRPYIFIKTSSQSETFKNYSLMNEKEKI